MEISHIEDILINGSKNFKNKIACVSLNNKNITYNELYLKSKKLADFFIKTGLENQSHIGLVMANSINFLIVYFAIHLSGNIAVLINKGAKEWEIENIIKFCDISCLCLDDININFLKDKNYYEYSKNIHLLYTNYKNIPFSKEASVIIPTSGSMGNSKAVILSDKNILSNAEAYINQLNLTSADSVFIFLPLTSSFAHTTQMIAHLLLGGKIICGDILSAFRNFTNLIHKYKPSITGLIPNIFAQIIPSINPKMITSLKTIVLAGAPIQDSLIDEIENNCKNLNIVKAYGLTEASPRVTQLNIKIYSDKKKSVGKPLKGVAIKIVDKNLKKLPFGQIGEILVAGDNVMLGYYKNNENVFINKKWIKTGDTGFLDKDGFLYIKGRSKNIIIKNGMNIIPEEIEEFLCSLDFIEEAFVYEKKYSDGNEKIIAKLIIKNGIYISEGDIIASIRGKISSYKIPDEIIFVKKIEKTTNGKIKRIIT